MPTSEELVYASNPSFGGPASITVASDKGIFGTRGTQFFLSIGDPNIYGNLNYSIPESLNDNIQRFDFSAITIPASINAGQVLLNDFDSPTEIYISNLDNSGEDVTPYIHSLFLSIESVKGVIKINKNIPFQTNINITEFMVLQVLSKPITYDNYTVVSVTKFSESSAFSVTDGEEVILTMIDNPRRFDACININPLDQGYLDLYMFRDPRQSGESGTKWYNDLALTPGSFPINTNLTFTAGSAQLELIDYPLPDSVIPYIDQVISSNVSIQHSLIATMPTTSSAMVNETTGLVVDLENKTFTLTVDLVAKKYSGSTWSNLTGINMVHFVIAIDINQTVV